MMFTKMEIEAAIIKHEINDDLGGCSISTSTWTGEKKLKTSEINTNTKR